MPFKYLGNHKKLSITFKLKKWDRFENIWNYLVAMTVLRIKRQMLISNTYSICIQQNTNCLFIVEIWGCITEREMVTKNLKKQDSQKCICWLNLANIKKRTVSKGVFFQKVRFDSQISKRKIIQMTILSLKFE